MNLNKYLQEMEIEHLLIHPQNNARSVFYSIFLAFQINNKFPNATIDMILDKKFRFLRKMIPFKISSFKATKDYDLYISYLDEYKEVWKYRVIKARAKIGVSKLFFNKVFNFTVTPNDNLSILTREFLNLLKIGLNVTPYFIQNPFIPIIQNRKQLLISPYEERYIKNLVNNFNGEYDILYFKEESLEYLLTRVIYQYKKVVLLNSISDHFFSFIRDDIEILFASFEQRSHLYSNKTIKKVIEYPCAPCNINSVICPFRDEKSKYKCLKDVSLFKTY